MRDDISNLHLSVTLFVASNMPIMQEDYAAKDTLCYREPENL